MENVIPLVLLSIFYLLFPAFIIYLTQKYPIIDKIGAALICYGVGILMTLIWAVPENAGGLQEIFLMLTVPLAIPLMLFSMDFIRWLRLAPRTIVSLVFIIISVLTATTVGFLIFRDSIPGEAWKVGGMLIGVYTGGTPNLTAIGLGLNASKEIIVLTNTADMLACIPWIFFILLIGQKFMNLFLPKFESAGIKEMVTKGDDSLNTPEKMDFNDYTDIFKGRIVGPLSLAFLLAIVIFAMAGGLSMVVPGDYQMAVVMLTITTLGIASSFIVRVRNIEKTFQLGQYIVVVFCLVVGSMADIEKLFTIALGVVGYTVLVVYGSWIIHMLLSAIFRIDTDTTIITSMAAICSPPFVPVAASALKNKEIVVSGLTTGIIGYAIGNYLGILLAPLLLKIP